MSNPCPASDPLPVTIGRRRLLVAMLSASVLPGPLLAQSGRGGSADAAERAPDGPIELEPVRVGGATISATLLHGGFTLGSPAIRGWIERSAQVVRDYYGRFPVPQLHVRVHTSGGTGTRTGNLKGWGAMPRLNVWLGQASGRQDLRRDWIMVHEMVHAAFPDVHSRHQWMAEGLAVYVESVARMQAADLSPEHVWGEFANRMHHGLPGPGDQGLDGTPTWGRKYWGGAVFCLLADLEIRRRTRNAAGLREALRGVLAGGYDARLHAPLRPVLEVADAATGTRVLTELYEQMRATPVPVDLDGIWSQLGVVVRGKQAVFDAAAPEAWLREAITQGHSQQRTG